MTNTRTDEITTHQTKHQQFRTKNTINNKEHETKHKKEQVQHKMCSLLLFLYCVFVLFPEMVFLCLIMFFGLVVGNLCVGLVSFVYHGFVVVPCSLSLILFLSKK